VRGGAVQLFYWGACVIGRVLGKQVLIKSSVRFKRNVQHVFTLYMLSLVDKHIWDVPLPRSHQACFVVMWSLEGYSMEL